MPVSRWDMNIFSGSNHSNLDSFIRCVTPAVPVLAQPKEAVGGESSTEKRGGEVQFSLGDLWKCYEESSAYGVGVPIVLNKNESVVQYYSPSLSALQIFINDPIPFQGVAAGESKPTGGQANGILKGQTSGVGKKEEPNHGILTGQSSGKNEEPNQLGHLYLQFNETCNPYDRVPLSVKINELAAKYSHLKSFTSADLSPYSWVAVAWYPIYQVPLNDNKELSTCFVTYHNLSTSFQGVTRKEDEIDGSSNTAQRKNGFYSNGAGGKLLLTLFAMTTYRMFEGTLWLNPRTPEEKRLNAYRVAARNWLKHLNFFHHDFTFFTSPETCIL